MAAQRGERRFPERDNAGIVAEGRSATQPSIKDLNDGCSAGRTCPRQEPGMKLEADCCEALVQARAAIHQAMVAS